jgi:NAD(P)-dependent dehydrogenase (short-subunit alcohol dehydrogenase family)
VPWRTRARHRRLAGERGDRVEGDVADAAAVAAAVRATVERFGALHITVTTAAIINSIPVMASDGAPRRPAISSAC